MIKLNFKKIDWIDIRQSLSLSLFYQRPIEIIDANEYINKNNQSLPFYADIKKIVTEFNFGNIIKKNSSIIFTPRDSGFGIYDISTNKYSSMIELFLFLAPYFFNQKFRSVINFTGVTHSNHSYSTLLIKETLLNYLEEMGFYASFTLKRFGFYGSGGGKAESHIYPKETKNISVINPKNPKLTNITIFISKLNSNIAKREKAFLKEKFKLEDNQISIMEIIDSDGFGNSIQVRTTTDTIPIIFTSETEIYNSSGDFIFDEEENKKNLEKLILKVNEFLERPEIPHQTLKEISLYLILSGNKNLLDGVDNIIKNMEKLIKKFH
jgi:RNA 3'-terminal phosphate cyclase